MDRYLVHNKVAVHDQGSGHGTIAGDGPWPTSGNRKGRIASSLNAAVTDSGAAAEMPADDLS